MQKPISPYYHKLYDYLGRRLKRSEKKRLKILRGKDVKDTETYLLKSFHDNDRKESLKYTKAYVDLIKKQKLKKIMVSERLYPKSGLFEIAVKKDPYNLKILRKSNFIRGMAWH